MSYIQRVKPIPWNVRAGLTNPNLLSFWRGLVFATLPGGIWQQDIISGNRGTLFGTTVWDGVSQLGAAIESDDVNNDGVYWPVNYLIHTVTNDLTIHVVLEIDSWTESTVFFSIPYSNSGWSQPWFALGFNRNSSTDVATLFWNYSGINYRISPSPGDFLSGIVGSGPVSLSVTRSGSTISFYRDGVFIGAGSSIGDAIIYTNDTQISLLSRSPNSPGGGIAGRHLAALLWNRSLLSAEIAILDRDVFDPFRMADEAGVVYGMGAPSAGRTTHNTDPYGLGTSVGISRTFKVHA